MVNISGFEGHTVSGAALQLFHLSRHAATDSMHDCVPIKFYLQKQMAGWIWFMNHSLQTHLISWLFMCVISHSACEFLNISHPCLNSLSAMDWMCVPLCPTRPPPPKFICWSLLWGGDFRRWLDHEGGTLMMGLVPLEKRPQRAPSSSTREYSKKTAIYEARRGLSWDT